MTGLIYLLNTCVPGILESTQGQGHLKSCLLGPRPALTSLALTALGDPSSRDRGSLITATGSGTDSTVVA